MSYLKEANYLVRFLSLVAKNPSISSNEANLKGVLLWLSLPAEAVSVFVVLEVVLVEAALVRGLTRGGRG